MGAQIAPERKKIKFSPAPFSNSIPGIPFEGSWVFAQEVQSSSQDSLTPGIYDRLEKGREEAWHLWKTYCVPPTVLGTAPS